MPNPIRMKRISDSIREELATLLIREVSDPRLAGISITDVKVDRELAYAEIYVSAIEGQERSAEVLKTLRHAGGYLRTLLAQRVDLRAFPRLRFHWDVTPERAEHIERLLAEIRAQAPPEQPAAEGAAAQVNAEEEKMDRLYAGQAAADAEDPDDEAYADDEGAEEGERGD
jgi:ribosome-binding factor A